jgi:ADP-heptose:LPS heptosyltransferase
MMSQAASSPYLPIPPQQAGHYSAEVVTGPEGPIALYHFAFEGRCGRRLLVLKLDHYGDFLIGLPALKRLREVFSSDHITLVCGSWNVELAEQLGVADEVRAYDFFPQNGALWNGQPFEGLDRFREICRGNFDIAIDLRVDEDTRPLLRHVEAAMRCGIGVRVRHPFLDIVLPAAFEHRESGSEGRWISIQPDQFESQMPLRTPFFHETNFSLTNAHLVYGPYLVLPEGRFRAQFCLRLLAPFPRFSRVEIVVDVTRTEGFDTIASAHVGWRRNGDPRNADLSFTNDKPGTRFEFRIHARGRPMRTRLQFFGVRLELIGGSDARFKRAELHVGEQLSLLVELIEQRTRKLYAEDLFAGAPVCDFAETSGAPPARRIVVSPLSNSELRDWGLANYARLVALLLERTECDVVLVGSKAQRGQVEFIVEANGGNRRIVNIAGDTDWFQTAEIVRTADLVIANNSGVAHLAAACGTPTLAIYSGSHQPQEWGPRGNNVRAVMALVPCSPCGYDKLEECPNDHLCMKRIAPETIANQAVAMLSGASGGQSSHPEEVRDSLTACERA